MKLSTTSLMLPLNAALLLTATAAGQATTPQGARRMAEVEPRPLETFSWRY